jgi:hypothetical protein
VSRVRVRAGVAVTATVGVLVSLTALTAETAVAVPPQGGASAKSKVTKVFGRSTRIGDPSRGLQHLDPHVIRGSALPHNATPHLTTLGLLLARDRQGQGKPKAGLDALNLRDVAGDDLERFFNRPFEAVNLKRFGKHFGSRPVDGFKGILQVEGSQVSQRHGAGPVEFTVRVIEGKVRLFDKEGWEAYKASDLRGGTAARFLDTTGAATIPAASRRQFNELGVNDAVATTQKDAFEQVITHLQPDQIATVSGVLRDAGVPEYEQHGRMQWRIMKFAGEETFQVSRTIPWPVSFGEWEALTADQLRAEAHRDPTITTFLERRK